MSAGNVNRIWIVEWCSTGEQRGRFNVAEIDDIVRTNMQVFSGTRAAKYNERWIMVGAFYNQDKAQEWVETLSALQESGKLRNTKPDYRLVPQPVDNFMDLAVLKSLPYDDYLKTEYWQQVRKESLRRAKYRCQMCNADAPLDVHHRTYETRGEETTGDVIALCRDCHAKYHGKNK